MSAPDFAKPSLSEEHVRLLLDAGPDAMVVSKDDGKIVLVNMQTEKLFGYARKELLGKKVEVLLPQRFRGRHVKHRGSYVSHASVRPMGSGLELFGRRKDGTEFAVDISLSPVEAGGEMLVASSIRDVTDRKQAEEALRHSEERFRVALRNAPVAVFNQDKELRYSWINSNVQAWMEQACLGRTDLEIVGGEEGARLTAIKKQVLRSGRGTRTETQIVFEGETYYFDLVVEPLRDAHGAILGLTCSASDITRTKRSLLAQASLIAKLQNALEEVKLLSGLVSICASCKRIINERKVWEPVESYIQSHSRAKFTHGLCPDCLHKLYPDYYPKSTNRKPRTARNLPA